MSVEINNALVRLRKRAEDSSLPYIRESFVDVGPLVGLLASPNHQVIYGRRGTGKTHTLRYLGESVRSGDVASYVDMRSVGSSRSLYEDTNQRLPDRGTRLLLDVAGVLHETIRLNVYDNLDKLGKNAAQIPQALDDLADACTQVEIRGNLEVEQRAVRSSDERGSSQVVASPMTASVSVSRGHVNHASEESATRTTGVPEFYVHFGDLRGAVQRVLQILAPNRLWLLLDEWNSLPQDLQPYLADLLRRSLFGLPGISMKVGAVQYLSQFSVARAGGGYLGIQLGSDAFADVDLDDYLVYDFDPGRSTEFFRRLIARHAQLELKKDQDVQQALFDSDPSNVVSATFTTEDAFSEFVKAAEGIPRDGMGILGYAAQYAGASKINQAHVRRAAKKWYETNKAPGLAGNYQAETLLFRIVSEVIGTRNTRGFLVDRQQARHHEAFNYLYDERFLHLVRSGISSPSEPGRQFDAYVLDYGCYVDTLGTRNPPRQLTLFVEDEEVGLDSLEVPNVDYRSVRRAVLDLDEISRQ